MKQTRRGDDDVVLKGNIGEFVVFIFTIRIRIRVNDNSIRREEEILSLGIRIRDINRKIVMIKVLR